MQIAEMDLWYKLKWIDILMIKSQEVKVYFTPKNQLRCLDEQIISKEPY